MTPEAAAQQSAFVDDLCAYRDDADLRAIFADWLKEQNRWTWETVLGFVLAKPGPDGPRLLAADWCEQNGDEWRASHIRAELRHDVHALTPFPSFRWFESQTLRVMIQPVFNAITFLSDKDHAFFGTISRGFIGSIKATSELWLTHGDELTATHPITEVELQTMPNMEASTIRRSVMRWTMRATERERTAAIDTTVFDETAIATKLLRCLWPSVRRWKLPRSNGGMPAPNEFVRDIAQSVIERRQPRLVPLPPFARGDAT